MLKKIGALCLCLILCGSVVQAASPAWTNVDGIYYNDKGEVIKGAVKKGIDVSWHQGEIDWTRVKASGVDFALIRCGYGDDLVNQDDICFAANVSGCEANAIDYGIYLYSYATDTLMAESEAVHVLRLIEETQAKPTMPIYLDFEDQSQSTLTPSEFAIIAKTYCQRIAEAGYEVGVYANLSWWNEKLTEPYFESLNRWVAQYNSSCAYKKTYDIWQCKQDGVIDGIQGNVDVNILLARSCSLSGHTYTMTSVIQKATTKNQGSYVYQCKVCGHKKTDYLPAATLLTLGAASYTYTGKTIKPKVTVKDSKGRAISSAYYSVSYTNHKNIGTGIVTVTLKGAYSGTLKKTFTIQPAKTIVSKVTNVKGKKAKVSWKKVTKAQGYEICYAKNSKFTSGRKTVTAGAKTTTKTIVKLSKKTYYVRVRAYTKVSGKKIYGSWSTTKKVKIKK